MVRVAAWRLAEAESQARRTRDRRLSSGQRLQTWPRPVRRRVGGKL